MRCTSFPDFVAGVESGGDRLTGRCGIGHRDHLQATASQFDRLGRWRLPRINRAGLIAFVMILMFAQDVIGELITLVQGVDRYPWVGGGISLWPGTDYQFPLYEGLGWGCGMVGWSAVIYCFRNSGGEMITDRGLDRLKIRRGRTLVRVLALGAVFNLAMLVFMVGFGAINQHADTTQPTVPSYLQNGMCGLGGNPPCVRDW
ncbi:spirocyclase AveC family protein [Nocardia nova]